MIDLATFTQDCGDYEKFHLMTSAQPFLVLDTETTGLSYGAEIINIAIIGHDDKVYLDTLLKPTKRIPEEASRIHGITNEACADAPRWAEIKPYVMDLISYENLVVYNSLYDRKMLHFTDTSHLLPETNYKEHTAWWCAMNAFAQWYGDRHPYYGTYRWQKLATAVEIIEAEPQIAHRALGDCKMTLSLIKRLVQICEPNWHTYFNKTKQIPF